LSRVLVGLAARSIAQVDEEVTLPQFRTLVLLVSRGPQRVVDLAGELSVRTGLHMRRREVARSRSSTSLIKLSDSGRMLADPAEDIRGRHVRDAPGEEIR
jgi:hypothetical protein